MEEYVSNVSYLQQGYVGVINARAATLEGRSHYVLPVTMLVTGVHNGSAGPVTYTAAEVRASVKLWNGKPVVVYHPKLNGQGVSAADPDVLSRQRIGTIFNTKFDGHRLEAEAWIDAERVAQVDERVAEAIRLNRKMEVSTGLYFVLDGEIARNHQPDHLAILPDQIGACSIADGCGLFQTNEEEVTMNQHDEEVLQMPTMGYAHEMAPTVNNGGGDRDDNLLPLPTMNYQSPCGCSPVANADDDVLHLPSMDGHVA